MSIHLLNRSSVEGCRRSIRRCTRLDILSATLDDERERMKRTTLILVLEVRIRKICNTTYAVVWQSGRIDFNPDVPTGAISIGKIRSLSRYNRICANARLAYDNKTLLVPGVPEAAREEDAMSAVHAFMDRIDDRKESGPNACGHFKHKEKPES